MVIKLFDHVYLAYPGMNRSDVFRFRYVNIENIFNASNIDLETPPNIFFHHIISCLLDFPGDNEIFLIPRDKDVYISFLAKYVQWLGFDYEMFECLVSHTIEYQDIWIKRKEYDKLTDMIFLLGNTDKILGDINNIKSCDMDIKLFPFIPIEYTINMADTNRIVRYKANKMRVYDIINEMIDLIKDLFYMDQEIPKFIMKIFTDNNRKDMNDIIRNNHDIEDNIKTIFNDYGRNMDLFSNSMIQYLTLDTSKGYSEDGSYRYNRKLATKVLYNHYEINVTGKFSDSLQIK
jgi:hypothetical protein